MDRDKFVDLLSTIAELYKQELSIHLIDIYYGIFRDYDYIRFENAMMEVMKNHKYHTFPKPAEILEFLEGTMDDKCLMGWMQVMDAIKKGGYYASIEFSDPIVPHCIKELGGWQWLCSQMIDEFPFIQKRFADLYKLFLKRGEKSNFKTIGFHEERNRLSGWQDESKVIRIGFKEKQKQIEKKAK